MSKVKRIKEPAAMLPEINTLIGKDLVLGLDLGTSCGYAFATGSKRDGWHISPYNMGVWDLSAGPYDSGAIRFVRLRHFLNQMDPSLVVYEDVKFTPAEALTKFSAARVLARAATSSELIGAFRAHVCEWCESENVPCYGIPIGSIKKRATGKGNSGKEDVILACNQEFGTDFKVEDYKSTGADNVADAAFICAIALEEAASGLK